jgi:hypothetical protein
VHLSCVVSLPPDDVSYRSFFAARRQRALNSGDKPEVRCTIIGYDKKMPGWTDPVALRREDFSEGSAVHSALEIFGSNNVRFYGGGVPAVFLDDAGKVSAQRLEDLLMWPAA